MFAVIARITDVAIMPSCARADRVTEGEIAAASRAESGGGGAMKEGGRSRGVSVEK